MSVAHPVVVVPSQFGAVVARQISVWPFAARMQRLFLLVDPSGPNAVLREGLVRAMQQAYFRSDGQSQTRCVREAALAAHYVLTNHNREVLPLDQVCAATAVAAVRGRVAFVGLAGDASAFAWRNGHLTGLHGRVRLARPLGLEAEPRVALWCTALDPGDRVVLVTGAEGRADAPELVQQVLELEQDVDATEQRVCDVLGGARPTGVLLVEPARRRIRTRPNLRLLPPVEQPRSATPRAAPSRDHTRTAITAALGALVLAALAALVIAATAPRAVAPASAPVAAADHRFSVDPWLAVRLGPSGGNVIDLAVGDDALYTLDVGEGSIRAFGLDAYDQPPLPDTLVARTGASIVGTTRRLDQPVAIQYVRGGLTIVDRTRALIQVGRDRALALRTPPSSATWGELGALGSDLAAHLFVLDSAARQLLDYPLQNQRPQDPPRVLLDPSVVNLPWEHVAEVVAVDDATMLRLEDGTVRRFGSRGDEESFIGSAPDGRRVAAAGITPDRAGGLYLADAANARVVHTTADGAYVRELRHPALAGVRQLKSSLDGRRLYGLVASGVLAFDVPDADPGN